MYQSEAEVVFSEKVNEELEKLYEFIKKSSADGISEMTFYPPYEALLKSMMKELKAKGYWVKEVTEIHAVYKGQVDEWTAEGKIFCYIWTIGDDGKAKYWRRGLRIWWKKPGFFEYYF